MVLKGRFAGENNPRFSHGLTDGNSYRHPIYVAWQNMKARCFNPNYEKYHRYGGRGITICEEWLNVKNFSEWAFANGWSKGLTLDRIDNNGNYEPSNCQWVSVGKNSRKKSTTKLTIEQAKEIRSRSENENWNDLAKEFNINHGTVWFIAKNISWDENLR